jgi:hypothetical protein
MAAPTSLLLGEPAAIPKLKTERQSQFKCAANRIVTLFNQTSFTAGSPLRSRVHEGDGPLTIEVYVPVILGSQMPRGDRDRLAMASAAKSVINGVAERTGYRLNWKSGGHLAWLTQL